MLRKENFFKNGRQADNIWTIISEMIIVDLILPFTAESIF